MTSRASDSEELVRDRLKATSALLARLASEFSQELVKIADQLVVCFRAGGKVLFCGNGGSAADAQHLAAEFVVRLREDRRPFPALALTVNSSVVTAAANDWGFDRVFARQVEALGNKGDVLVAISTSGNSPNIVSAVETARKRGLVAIGLLGKGGGEVAKHCDHSLVVPHDDVLRIQEAHIALGHVLCELLEKKNEGNPVLLQAGLGKGKRSGD